MVAEFTKSLPSKTVAGHHKRSHSKQLDFEDTPNIKHDTCQENAHKLSSTLNNETLEWLVKYSQERSCVDNYALPGYFIVTGRNGLQLIAHHDGYFPVCQHPNLNERLLIFPPVGNARSINEYLNKLDPWPKNGVQLARIPTGEKASILGELNKEWEIIPMQEDILDWGVYPVRSLPVKEMAIREGKQYKNHRRKYNHADKRVHKLEILESWSSEKNYKFETFLYRWAERKCVNDKNLGLDDYVSPYLNIVSMHSNCAIGSACLLFENYKEDVLGMVVIEVFNGIASAYMNIATDEVPYFAAYILMRSCEFLYERQLAEVLCLGGSERESLDKFKSDLQPSFARDDSRLSYHLNSFLVKPLSN